MLSTKLKEVAGNGADATLYVDNVFSTWLYDGAGASQTVDNGIDLAGKGGLVWIKQRNGPSAHNLRDTVRGNNYALNSALTNAQSSGWSTVFNFTSTGYAITGTNDQYNGAGGTYAAWTFRKAAKFFDVVTYTGTGSARTIAHSLGVAPGMVIVKRTDTTGNWQVYSNGLTSAAYSIQLNLTDAQASAPTVWNSTAPTSSVFSVGTDATVNASGGTYVAYLYAHDTSSTGIIQCGSYTGNGTTNNISLGWEAQYVLIKSASSARPWVVFDTMRGFCNSSSPSSNALFPNASTAETSYYGPTPTATGFGMLAGDGDFDYNASGQTYIYMAIRRPNKPPTSGTQVFSPVAVNSSASTQSVDAGFPVDLVIKDYRNLVNGAMWFDRLRGITNSSNPRLISASTNAEVNSNDINGAYQTGVTEVGIGTGYTSIDWFFKRAPGFFDVVCWTGVNGATNQRVNHNLTVVPELIIYKGRNKVNYWRVYYGNINQYIALNLDSAVVTGSNFWGSSAPTTTDFGINCGSMDLDNFNAVAYLFATLAGIQYINSYVGDGTTGRVINCGFSAGARFICIKATSTTGSWWVWDSARGITSANDPALQLNSTAAEITSVDAIDPSSSGFIVNQEATCSINASGVSYLVWAIA